MSFMHFVDTWQRQLIIHPPQRRQQPVYRPSFSEIPYRLFAHIRTHWHELGALTITTTR